MNARWAWRSREGRKTFVRKVERRASRSGEEVGVKDGMGSIRHM